MGPQERKLKAIIKRKMEGQIQLQGIKSNAYVRQAMYQSNCLLMLSNYETFGVVIRGTSMWTSSNFNKSRF